MIKDRVLETIEPHVLGKSVLDVGCVEHSTDNIGKARIWVHGFLKQRAAKLVGIDILEKDIQELKQRGYDVEVQNAESFRFDDRFEVILAGELVEHLSNPGGFLDSCQRALADDGRLILTTPNAYALSRLLRSLVRLHNDPPVNEEHTAWYSPRVLATLLARHGFEIERIAYADYPLQKPRRRDRLFNLLRGISPRTKETMIAICRKSRADAH
jgi:SAM-dependent methyltransferase